MGIYKLNRSMSFKIVEILIQTLNIFWTSTQFWYPFMLIAGISSAPECCRSAKVDSKNARIPCVFETRTEATCRSVTPALFDGFQKVYRILGH